MADLRLRQPRPVLGDHSLQFCDPERPATYVRGAGDWRRWEFRLEPDAPAPGLSQIWERLTPWITPDGAHLERSAVYTFRSGLAGAWQKGRVFLAGDAAHQMPPFMGQGMCAGIRDAGNLAWKLAAARHGLDVLDTYERERKPQLAAINDLT